MGTPFLWLKDQSNENILISRILKKKQLIEIIFWFHVLFFSRCDVSAVSKLVKEEIEGVSLKNTKNELIYNLPINEAANFPQLLEKLDGTLHELDVGNIGIKVATMEDVFLK